MGPLTEPLRARKGLARRPRGTLLCPHCPQHVLTLPSRASPTFPGLGSPVPQARLCEGRDGGTSTLEWPV